MQQANNRLGRNLFPEGKCFCTCGVNLLLLSLTRGQNCQGVTHEKRTWFTGLRVALVTEPPAHFNSPIRLIVSEKKLLLNVKEGITLILQCDHLSHLITMAFVLLRSSKYSIVVLRDM